MAKNNNTGYRNSGYRNSGYGNSGYGNSGDRNSGNGNSGNWNSGNGNSGAFNTDEPTVRMFNKPTGLHWEDIDFPDYMYFDLTEWVYKEDMTKEEKEEHPEYETTGGYLKVYEYKEAWQEAWAGASEEEKQATLELPNFSWSIFTEITGIKPNDMKGEDKMIELSNGKKVSESTVMEALRAIAKD